VADRSSRATRWLLFVRVDMETVNYRERLRPADALALPNSPLLIDLDDARPLAQAIVDTIRDPLLVLDQDLRVVTANRAFYQAFRMNRQDIHGRPVYGLGDGQWDIPELRLLLEGVAPQHAVMEAYEVERDFPIIGRRSMLLNARELFFQKTSRKLILLAIEDVTERRAAEREIAQAAATEGNAAAGDAASRCQQPADHRRHPSRSRRGRCSRRRRGCIFEDAHQRVMSVAAVQQQLLASGHGGSDRRSALISLDCAKGPGSLDDGRQSSGRIAGPGGRRHQPHPPRRSASVSLSRSS
jgi:hypothetical protein